jgi:uncharacterized protein (TIGR03435 family)
MRFRVATLCVVLALLPVAPGKAQPPAFDVASVKANQTAAGGERAGSRSSIDSVPGSLTVRNASLGACINWAFDVRDYQIAGPGWLYQEKYDIAAKAAGPVPTAQLRRMLQTLLADRFKLQVHRETRELPVYALVVTRSGPKLHTANPDSNTDMRGENGSFVFRGTSMAQFADDLSTMIFVDRPVLDRTGIPGVFDFSLKFADSNAEMKRATLQGDGPSIFTIVQEQLGLKMEAQKGPIEMLVIDRVEKTPVEN